MSGRRHGAPVAVLASRVRREEKWIMEALERRAAPYEHLDTRTLWRFADDDAIPPWSVVLNREIAHTRALYAAVTLESRGVRVVNTAAATDVCGDKWRTTLALREAGLPVPRTALALSPEAALGVIEAVGYPAVVKPLNGSWGRRVARVRDPEMAETLMEYVAALPDPRSNLVYVQELVADGGRDIRVVVVGGQVAGATYRSRGAWRANVALGGSSEFCPVTPEITKLAVTAAEAVGAEIAGVDLIQDVSDAMFVLEVNDRVEFAGFQEAMGPRADMARLVVEHLLGVGEEGVISC
ncbi:RimK family alpha-L-glutamate ligase [Nonomuraea sp. NPDC052116]|uniref:RimK family alpha-L-glutamate ligase n=1 Tax=Nonomuraea sp. NPDC052116 TaxID=3155665 RepID=UPI00342E1BCC